MKIIFPIENNILTYSKLHYYILCNLIRLLHSDQIPSSNNHFYRCNNVVINIWTHFIFSVELVELAFLIARLFLTHCQILYNIPGGSKLPHSKSPVNRIPLLSPLYRLNFLNKQITNHENVHDSVYWSTIHCYKASLECSESMRPPNATPGRRGRPPGTANKRKLKSTPTATSVSSTPNQSAAQASEGFLNCSIFW